MVEQPILENGAEVDCLCTCISYAPKKFANVQFLNLVAREYDALADPLAREHGKTISDVRGDLQRGLEVVEFTCES
jgi:hypothetical protein